MKRLNASSADTQADTVAETFYGNHCPRCGYVIAYGERLTNSSRGWVHVECGDFGDPSASEDSGDGLRQWL